MANKLRSPTLAEQPSTFTLQLVVGALWWNEGSLVIILFKLKSVPHSSLPRWLICFGIKVLPRGLQNITAMIPAGEASEALALTSGFSPRTVIRSSVILPYRRHNSASVHTKSAAELPSGPGTYTLCCLHLCDARSAFHILCYLHLYDARSAFNSA